MKNVYFVRPVGQKGPVKIGCSKTPIGRLKSIEVWSPLLLEICADAPGGFREENILHQMFGADQLHGEWFAYSEQLGDVIAYVQRSGKLPPLDYGLSSYKIGSTRKVARRNAPAAKQKSKAGSLVTSAEVHAFGFEKPVRPAEVADIMARWQGVGNPPPTEQELAVLHAYAAKLRQAPKAERNFAAWVEWFEARKTGQAA